MFWGLTPALDFQEELECINMKIENDEINILIIGGCDARHILKTLSQSYRHKKVAINIHVVESCSELIARQLLLLSIALTNEKYLGLQEKTRYFMEVYGNTLLRSISSRYLMSSSKHLINMITNLEYMNTCIPSIRFENVKYKERDYIEILLKFWGTSNTNMFDICYLWDKRIRNSLGVRYDSRLGVFDWDYNMRLRDMGGAIVNSQEFKHFRSTGVAYTWLETEVSRPNCSLAAGVLKYWSAGDQFLHHGYLGDIVTGPYIAYGLTCKDKNMLNQSHGTFYQRSTDVTERNIMRMLYELEFHEEFNSSVVDSDYDHNLGLVTLAMMDAKLSDPTDSQSTGVKFSCDSFINLDYAKIFFHSSSALEHMPEKLEFQKKFQALYVGYNFSKKVKPSLMKMMENKGLLVIEGCKFILDMKKDDIKLFKNDVDRIVKDWSCELIGKFEPLEDSYAKLLCNV